MEGDGLPAGGLNPLALAEGKLTRDGGLLEPMDLSDGRLTWGVGLIERRAGEWDEEVPELPDRDGNDRMDARDREGAGVDRTVGRLIRDALEGDRLTLRDGVDRRLLGRDAAWMSVWAARIASAASVPMNRWIVRWENMAKALA